MRENSILKERILQFLDFKRITKYEFYQKTGISNGILSQKNGISEENILKFLSVFNEISLEWLLTGKGDMLKTDEFINIAVPVSQDEPKAIPFYDGFAVGGKGGFTFTLTQQDVKDYYIVPKFNDKKIDFMIEVTGSSMYPKYNSGDVVACTIINENTFIQWNKVHVIATREQGLLIKRLHQSKDPEKLTLVSDNKNYPPFDIPKEEICGIAIVAGVIRLE